LASLRQAFNAGVLAYWGIFAIADTHAHHPEEALLDILLASSTIFLLRHINQKPSP
jgi:hypothetical protein